MKASLRFLTIALLLAAVATTSLGTGSLYKVQAQDDNGVKLNPEVSGDIEFWHFWASPIRRNAVRRVIAICKELLPNINVTDTVKPFGDIWTANVAAVSAGSGMPDVIVEDRPQLAKVAADGVEQSLQALADRDGVDAERFWPFAWNQTLYNGETYGIPFETDVRVLFYNKTLFAAAGLDPEKPPQTWEEVEAAADKLDVKNADGTYARIGFLPLGVGNVGEDLWSQTTGYDWMSTGSPKVDDPAMVETLTWLKKWYDRYGGYQAVQDFRASLGASPNDAFMSGKVAMVVDIAGYNSFLNFYRPSLTNTDGSTTRIDWGVALPPYSKTPASVSGGFALSIPTGAENPEAAWEFIKCATGEEAQVSWARDTYAIPTDVEAANNGVLMAEPVWKFFVDAMKVSHSDTFVPGYPNWREQLNQRWEAIYKGDLPIEQALKEAQAAIDQTIAENQ
jgi:multiple sugar transport system substrate-binding protein